MTDIRESPQFKMGMASADMCERFLRTLGWHTFRLDNADTDKAPVFRSTYGVEVAPDIEGHRSGEVAYFEIKAKTQPTVFRQNGSTEHRIDRRHWLDYLKVTQQSGLPCLLMVHEVSTGNILARRIKRADPGRIADDNGNPMHYWVRDSFSIVAIKWTAATQHVVPTDGDRLAQWLVSARGGVERDLIDLKGRARM
jgi:hypothetical protein